VHEGAQHGGATASGPASGSGYEIILQGFNWESHRQPWYNVRHGLLPAISVFAGWPSSAARLLGMVVVCSQAVMSSYLGTEPSRHLGRAFGGHQPRLLHLTARPSAQVLREQVPKIADDGITVLWLPPPSDSVSPQGYLPRDLYDLDSAYGSEVHPCSNTVPAFPVCRSHFVQGDATAADQHNVFSRLSYIVA